MDNVLDSDPPFLPSQLTSNETIKISFTPLPIRIRLVVTVYHCFVCVCGGGGWGGGEGWRQDRWNGQRYLQSAEICQWQRSSVRFNMASISARGRQPALRSVSEVFRVFDVRVTVIDNGPM